MRFIIDNVAIAAAADDDGSKGLTATKKNPKHPKEWLWIKTVDKMAAVAKNFIYIILLLGFEQKLLV